MIIAVIAAVSGDGGGDDDVAGPDTTTTTTQPLNDVAQELVDRLAAARRRELHLSYTGSLAGQPDGRITIEVWWKGDRARQTVIAESPPERQESAGFVLPTGNVFCQRAQDIEWLCQKAESTATASGRPAGIIEALAAGLNGKEVTSSPQKVGDLDAECYVVDVANGDVLCLRDDDIPVKFSFGGSELVFTTVETTVDDAAFEVPAEILEQPAGPAVTTTTAPK